MLNVKWSNDVNRETSQLCHGRNNLTTYKLLLQDDFITANYVSDIFLARTQRRAMTKFNCEAGFMGVETEEV